MDAKTAAIIAQAAALLASLAEDQPATRTRKPKAAKSQPASLVAAKVHCHDARMARRSSTKLGGLTKAERSALYHGNPQLATMTPAARKAAWTKLVVAYKAAN